MPPITWLSTSAALMIRPQSCAAATRSTRTSPVSVSTSTSMHCAPQVRIDFCFVFSPRLPLALPDFFAAAAAARTAGPRLASVALPALVGP
jgi:hypothetical protein